MIRSSNAVAVSTLVICLLSGVSLFAQNGLSSQNGNSSQAGVSTATATLSEAAPKASRFKIGYFGDLTVPVSKTEKGEWFHEPSLDYAMDGYSLKFKAPFYTYSTPNDRSRITEIDDLSFGAGISRLVNTEYFKMNAGVNVTAPTSYYTKTLKQRTHSFGASLLPSTTFGTADLKLDWLSLFKTYHYVGNSELDEKNLGDLDKKKMDQYKIEFYPSLSYSLTDSFATVLAGNIEFKQRRNTSLNEWLRTENSLHFGFNYKVAKQLSIRPEVRFPDPAKLNSDTANAGVLFFGSL